MFYFFFIFLFVLRVCSEGGGLVTGSWASGGQSPASSLFGGGACGLSGFRGWLLRVLPGLWPTLGLKRLVLGDLSALGRGGADVPDFLRNFFVLIAHSSGPLAVDFGGSSRGLGLYRLLLFGVLLGWRGARGQLWASSGWFSGLLSFAGHLWPAPRV